MIGLPFAASTTRAVFVVISVRRVEHAEVDGLEVREQRVVALDRQHGLPRLDPVAVVERVDGERVPVVEQSLRTAIASSTPPSIARLRWKTCITTRGRRSSLQERLARVVEVRVGVVALPHLLDRELEDLGRKAAPSPLLGRHARPRARGRRRAPPRRPRAARATARPSRSGAAARGPASRAPARADGPGGASSSAKTSTAAPTAPIARRDARRAAELRRRARGEDVAGRGRDEQRPDQVRAAALVLLRALLAVLVRPDRDVLGAVVGGELAAAQREQRRRERERAGDELARGRARGRSERRTTWTVTALASVAASTRGPLERQARLRQAPAQLGEERRTTRRAAAARAGTGSSRRGAKSRLRPDATLTSPSSLRTAHAHAVGPCTSTPFASAIPPRRILSARSQPWSERSLGGLASQRGLQLVGRRAAADRPAVERGHGHHLAHGRRRERLVARRRGARARSAPARRRSRPRARARAAPPA